jgi:hypothetical protein
MTKPDYCSDECLYRDYERERIIKLLEERYAENVDHCEWGTHLFLDNAIELIKEETE